MRLVTKYLNTLIRDGVIKEEDQVPEKVVFSQRAFLALVCEVAEHLNTETGGLFLGYRFKNYWYVLETIDPGPEAILRPAYFEYEKKYVEHQLNKQARLYKPSPSVLGLWHRHPGSFDKFSSTDDQTNLEFVRQCGPNVISALVNIDPDFRLTVYLTDSVLEYRTIQYEVEHEIRDGGLKDYSAIIESMRSETGKYRPQYKDRLADKVLEILDNVVLPRDDQESLVIDSQRMANTETWLEEFFSLAESDLSFLGGFGITASFSLVDDTRLQAALRTPSSEDIIMSVLFGKNGDDFVIIKGETARKYVSGTIKEMVNIGLRENSGEE